MCDYSLGVYDRGVEKGIAQGMAQGMAQGIENAKLADIMSIMKNLGMSLDKALEALNVPKSDYAKYEELLK